MKTLFSFLRELYLYHKVLFIFLVGFLVSSIYINYKWGVTAYPIYNYGMYSQLESLRDTISFTQPILNTNSAINLLHEPNLKQELLTFYRDNYASSKTAYQDINTTLEHKLHLTHKDPLSFPNDSQFQAFNIRFQATNLGVKIDSLSYKTIYYFWSPNNEISSYE